MRTFSCTCGSPLFFENVTCLRCQRDVGWCPSCAQIAPVEPSLSTAGVYQCAHPGCGATLRKCRNYSQERVCNRMVPVADTGEARDLCDCCRYNAVIPDLSVDGHRQRWAELEAAKRRLFYTLDLLGLPHGTGTDGFEPPLSFAFMASELPDAGLWREVANQRKVYTGHRRGRITINVREADDVERERLRVDLNESHRTLIGHFRHEIGHYYWELLVAGKDEPSCREVFGDPEDPPYADALEAYYARGPFAGWEGSYLSAYATMHPWEDFAETFAFYLAMIAILDTAQNLRLLPVDGPPPNRVEEMRQRFVEVGLVTNELNREMGLSDLVPHLITPSIETKLCYIDRLVKEQRRV